MTNLDTIHSLSAVKHLNAVFIFKHIGSVKYKVEDLKDSNCPMF